VDFVAGDTTLNIQRIKQIDSAEMDEILLFGAHLDRSWGQLDYLQ